MNKIIVEISARHLHVTREHLDILFGKGYELTPKKDLSQPGQFACEERVRVEGLKGVFPAVSILGPVRPATQVEITLTDARTLGVTAPIRESGDIKGSAGVKLIGPKGEVVIGEGVIVAKRHIHVTPKDAQEMGLHDKQIVSVSVGGERALTFSEVVVRVSNKFQKRMHVDVDEANAACLAGETEGEIIV